MDRNKFRFKVVADPSKNAYQILPKTTPAVNEESEQNQKSALDSPSESGSEFLKEAYFAGDNFWNLEAAFGCVDGVYATGTGYCGGTVCEGHTGHTEAVKVVYDRRKVCFKALCDVFWQSHDPTKKEYMGFGVNTHYRSAIFYLNEEQRQEAHQSKIRHQMKINRRIVTKILPASKFFYAEKCHQKYYLQSRQCKLYESLKLRSSEQLINSQMACKLNGYVGQGMAIPNAIKDFIHS
eukprot:Gb_14193 [translate_table: standard]